MYAEATIMLLKWGVFTKKKIEEGKSSRPLSFSFYQPEILCL